MTVTRCIIESSIKKCPHCLRTLHLAQHLTFLLVSINISRTLRTYMVKRNRNQDILLSVEEVYWNGSEGAINSRGSNDFWQVKLICIRNMYA